MSFQICPSCKGLPFTTPLDQKKGVPCPLCGGVGNIDPEVTCENGCGRPGVVAIGDTFSCVTKDCQDSVRKSLDKSTSEEQFEEEMSARFHMWMGGD